MLSVSHVLTGVAIASTVHQPYLAIPLILASHYLLDAIPHWDAGTGLGNGSKSIKLALLHELPDLILSVILVLIFFPISLPISISQLLQTPQIWGFFIALLPDFLEAPRNFFHWEPRWLTPLNRFHHSFHHSIPRLLDGLAPQIILLTLIWLTR